MWQWRSMFRQFGNARAIPREKHRRLAAGWRRTGRRQTENIHGYDRGVRRQRFGDPTNRKRRFDPNTRVRSRGDNKRSRASDDFRVFILAQCACPFVPIVVWSSPANVRIGITLRVAVAAPEPKKVGVPFSLNEYTGRADTLSDPMGTSWPYDLSGVAASPRGIRLWPGRRSTRSRTPASQPTRLIRRKRLGPDSYCSPRRVRRCSTRCDERAEEGSTE